MKSTPRIVTVVGARPQFIKAAPVSRALKNQGFEEYILHTGQHYDANMSDIFFEELKIPKPFKSLELGSGSHAYQVGEGLQRLEPVLKEITPDLVLVYGDTNATLAGALAARQLGIRVAHIEAGLRSFNPLMIEEINRRMTDQLSSWLFAPTQTAVGNLSAEGITEGVYACGDVMLDASQLFLEIAHTRKPHSSIEAIWQNTPYWLLTLHRAETTNDPQAVKTILQFLDSLAQPILFPVHPRVKAILDPTVRFQHITCVEPLGYLDMLLAESKAALILTDSGGVQKEAAFMAVPCVTLREETEWVETVDAGWNRLVGLSLPRLKSVLESNIEKPTKYIKNLYGNGNASLSIAQTLSQAF